MQLFVLKGDLINGKHVSIVWLTSRMNSLANEVKRLPETPCLRDKNNWFPQWHRGEAMYISLIDF